MQSFDPDNSDDTQDGPTEDENAAASRIVLPEDLGVGPSGGFEFLEPLFTDSIALGFQDAEVFDDIPPAQSEGVVRYLSRVCAKFISQEALYTHELFGNSRFESLGHMYKLALSLTEPLERCVFTQHTADVSLYLCGYLNGVEKSQARDTKAVLGYSQIGIYCYRKAVELGSKVRPEALVTQVGDTLANKFHRITRGLEASRNFFPE